MTYYAGRGVLVFLDEWSFDMEEKTTYMTINEETAEEIENKMPEESELYDLADLFKVFGDSTRIKILYVLFENEMCVYDIASILNMTQSAISHQLRILKQNRLVKFRKEGKTVLYTLADEHVFTILSQGIEHVEE
ncbi:putative uncharacterized protein [Clostridium sp. CAG:253]|jgi:DNA-binding transcriptional ArsR family regulator|nr:putative uncharacterized protein [Clostridium sp. CAG:253]